MNSIYNRLLNYLPPYERDNEIFKAILKSIAIQLQKQSISIGDFIGQLFIDTATWGLDIWEKNLGIDINISLNYEKRREIIKAKFRSNHHVSDLLLEGVVEAITGVAPDVTFTQEGIIEIKFNNAKVNLSSLKLLDSINRIKQTFFDFQFYIVNDYSIEYILTSYEFLVDLRITEIFTTEDKIPGMLFNMLGRIESKIYEFGVQYGITEIMRTETILDTGTMTEILVENETPHNIVKFIRPGTKQVGEGEI